ncbi:hypothetical protein AAG565_00940 [Fontimonas sp. SYSU GA230001]|uniref:hypothetical protein n=1 Tax=Fontimonas sp. SYSU GA230001 TaxID=3142450 RepID=UPI0032B4FDA2
MTMGEMSGAQQLAAAGSGLFFAVGLFTGVWKWRHMLDSVTHLAPPYVDIAHRSALFYSFAGLLVWHFAGWSVWPGWLNLVAVALLIGFFATAIVTYIVLGIANRTDNQFKERRFTTTTGTWLLAAGEIVGFLLLLGGTLAGL